MEKKKNKWKIAFWCLLVVFLGTTAFLLYQNLDQAITISYMTDGYADKEIDLSQLVKVINNTKLSKNEIIKELDIEDYQIENDTISLNFVYLIFKNEKLDTITYSY